MLDNSNDAEPRAGGRPEPIELLWLRDGAIVSEADPSAMPDWAKPIVAAAWRRLGGAARE